NYLCGQVPQVPLPAPLESPYTLQGPALTASERTLKTPGEGERLAVSQASAPGHYVVLDGKGRTAAGFSLAVRPEENDLERVPVALPLRWRPARALLRNEAVVVLLILLPYLAWASRGTSTGLPGWPRPLALLGLGALLLLPPLLAGLSVATYRGAPGATPRRR